MGNLKFFEMKRSKKEKDSRYIRSSFAEVLSQYPEGITLIENEVKKKMPNWISSVSPADNIRNYAQAESRRLQSARPSTQTYRPNGRGHKTTAVKKEPVDHERPRMIGRSKSAKPILYCSEEIILSKKTLSSPAIIPLSQRFGLAMHKESILFQNEQNQTRGQN